MAQDQDLIAGMLRGEAAAFADLYQAYRTRLYQYALSLIRSRMEAEDVVHDVFVGLAKQVGAGRAPRELSAYLYVSVRNRCVDRVRRKRTLSLEEVSVELFVAPPGDEERIEGDQPAGWLRRLYPRHQLAPFGLAQQVEVADTLRRRGQRIGQQALEAAGHDLEFAAIARLQGASRNTVLSRYQYGLSKLRKELGIHVG